LVVRSSDGRDQAVTICVNLHRSECAKATLNDIADRLRIDRPDVLDVLANWDRQRLLTHLQKQTADQLREPAMRRFTRPGG
jgi:hypothetical protein